jgi:hypothetical protein
MLDATCILPHAIGSFWRNTCGIKLIFTSKSPRLSLVKNSVGPPLVCDSSRVEFDIESVSGMGCESQVGLV